MNLKSNGKSRLKSLYGNHWTASRLSGGTGILQPLLVALSLLLTGSSLSAAETEVNAALVILCGTPQEQTFLREQSDTWVWGQLGVFNRVFSPADGRVVYRLPVGNVRLLRVILKTSLLPYRLEFSADGAHWETLSAALGNVPKSTDFTNNVIDFSDAQRAAARASGYAWFRIQPAGESMSESLQLQYFRLEARGTSFPRQFARLNWEGQIAALAIGPMMILLGVITIGFIHWRWHAKARVWGAGAALWAVSVALKFVFAGLTLPLASLGLHAFLPRSWADLIYWCYAGLLTGIFECGIFLTIMKRLRRTTWTWHEALALGLGFGAMEAVAVGLYSIFATPLGGNDACLTTWPDALSQVFERLITLIFHTAAVVMAMYAVINRRWRWFALSFIYKSAIDTVAAWLLGSGTNLICYAWRMELICLAPFVIPGLLALFYLERKWKEPETGTADASCARRF